MHILHLYKTYYPDGFGGVEEVIFNLIENGHKFGFNGEVLTLTPNKPGLFTVANHNVYRCKRLCQIASSGFSLGLLQKFKEMAAKADIIHYHFPWPMADLAHFWARPKKPTVLTYHSDIVAQKNLFKIYKPLMNFFLNSVDTIVATSPKYIESSPVLQQFKSKVRYVLLGKDKNSLPDASPEKIEAWKKILGDKFFLFIGAFRYYKGLQYLLEASKGEQFTVALLGSGSQEKELKELAIKEKLNNVHFLGSLPDDDKAALLSLCRAVVFPSHKRSEAFGITLIEGAMFGKPLISCEIGTGTSYINEHMVTGLVIPPADCASLKKAMLMLSENIDLAEEMGLNAKKRYYKLFTAEKMLKSYADIYKQLDV